ncbi:hypothetical protein R3P38DRAFT_3327172 [Favolaschia claudopus]|uniref:Uncharacterized protein n=1 Tax=Favolaschia claudopus TaxID=2862362 RepID=A0AAW0A5Z6_9AGAR
MRELIGQRPNLVPTGLGHSGSAVDGGVLMPEDSSRNGDELELDDLGPPQAGDATPGHTPEPDTRRARGKRTFSERDNGGSGDDYEPSSDVESESAPQKVEDDDDGDGNLRKLTQRIPPKPAASAPADSAAANNPKATKKTRVAEFAEIAKEDEKTRQKELDLAALRTRHQMKVTDSKSRYLELREERKREERKDKHERDLLKLRIKERRLIQAHERRMQGDGRGGSQPSTSSTSHADFSFFGAAGSSQYAASEPSDYYAAGLSDMDNSNAIAGPSTSQIKYDDTGLPPFDFSSIPDSSTSY